MLFLIAVLIFAVANVFCTLSSTAEQPPYISDNDLKLQFSQKFFTRSQWNAKATTNQQKLDHPVDLVILAHTVTPFCTSLKKCSQIVQSIQNVHVNSLLSDISYNFLIGGDGNIYEGRGWDVTNSQRNQSISVSFIGNFVYDYLTEDMIDALQMLLTEGVMLKKLKNDYVLVCHNQTTATLSPGINVYKVVKTLPHFRAGNMREKTSV